MATSFTGAAMRDYSLDKFTSITVRTFGAVGDGVTDDTAAFQKAFDYIATLGGGEVLVPQTTFGTPYRLGKLYISRNTTFKLAPGVVIKRKGVTYGISNVVTGVNPLLDNNDPYSGHGNIKIIGGTWDGNIIAEAYLATGFNLFYFAGSKGITIENVTVKDMVTNHCVDLNGNMDVTIRDCKFLGYKDASVAQDRGMVEAIQCSQFIDDTQVYSNYMLGAPSSGILVDNNLFGASGTAGTIAYPAGFGTHTATNDALCSNIKITKNTFESCGYAAVVPYTYNNIKISENTFKSCAYGVRANNFTNGKTWDAVNDVWITGGATRKETTSISVTNNEFIDTVTTDVSILGTDVDGGGFWAVCSDITVANNHMLATTATKRTGYNVRLLLVNNGVVHNNKCEQAAVNILADTCKSLNVHDNYTDTSTTYGIQFSKAVTPPGSDSKYSSNHKISNNLVLNAGSHGIGNNSSFSTAVIGNTVIDWGRITAAGNGILVSGTDVGLVSGNTIRTVTAGIGTALNVATTATSNISVAYDNKISKPDGTLVAMGSGTNNVYGNVTY